MLQVHLFNCDNTYKLEPVEDLLNKVAELDEHHLRVVKHSFKLANMSEIVDKISTLAMNVAFFVVHAHESRLSINEDNAGIGYAKIYRALRDQTGDQTGGNVIIVIGGDDNYKEDGEEDRDFISRWAKRKVSSQFSEENIDGRKSFIFSWNKKHRPIHVAALRHHLNSTMKGKTFHYQPPKERQSSKAPTPTHVKDTGLVHHLEEQSSKMFLEEKNAQLKDESELSSSARSPLHEDQRLTEHRLEDKRGGRREGFTDLKPTSRRKASDFNSQGTTPEKNLSSGHETAKDVAVLGVSLTERSMEDVEKAFQDIAAKLNLSESPPVQNLQSVREVEEYLMKNHFRFCVWVLVINADRIKFDLGHQSAESRDYRQLLKTVVNHVDARVLVLICGSSSLSKQDEVRVEEVVKDFVNGTEKIVTGRLKPGIIDLKPNALAQLLTATSDVTRRGPNQRNCPEWGLQRETDRQVQTLQPQGATANYPTTTERGTFNLECELRYGKIFQYQVDFLKQFHDFKVVDSIEKNISEKYYAIPLASVKFFREAYDYLRYSVEIRSAEDPEVEGVKIADNETLMLSTFVRYGKVSFENGDIQFRREGFGIPKMIADDIKSEFERYPKVSLFIVRNEEGELRCYYITGKVNKALGNLNKIGRSIREYFKK